jgi:hypothetical protein
VLTAAGRFARNWRLENLRQVAPAVAQPGFRNCGTIRVYKSVMPNWPR